MISLSTNTILKFVNVPGNPYRIVKNENNNTYLAPITVKNGSIEISEYIQASLETTQYSICFQSTQFSLHGGFVIELENSILKHKISTLCARNNVRSIRALSPSFSLLTFI